MTLYSWRWIMHDFRDRTSSNSLSALNFLFETEIHLSMHETVSWDSDCCSSCRRFTRQSVAASLKSICVFILYWIVYDCSSVVYCHNMEHGSLAVLTIHSGTGFHPIWSMIVFYFTWLSFAGGWWPCCLIVVLCNHVRSNSDEFSWLCAI